MNSDSVVFKLIKWEHTNMQSMITVSRSAENERPEVYLQDLSIYLPSLESKKLTLDFSYSEIYFLMIKIDHRFQGLFESL